MTYLASLPGLPVRATVRIAFAVLAFSAAAPAQDGLAEPPSTEGAIRSLSASSVALRSREPSFEYESVWGGPSYHCGITRERGVECWGATGAFPGVRPNFGPHPTPQSVGDVADAVSIGAGSAHARC